MKVKHIFISIFALFLGFNGFSQSKSATNSFLKKELDSLELIYDISQAQFQNLKLRHAFIQPRIDSCYKVILKKYGTVTSLKHQIQDKKREIDNLGFDSDNIISNTTLSTYFQLLPTTEFDKELARIKDTTQFRILAPLPDISPEKLKNQNKILMSRIEELKGANDWNGKQLKELYRINILMETYHAKAFADMRVINKVEFRYVKRLILMDEKIAELETNPIKKSQLATNETQVGSNEPFGFSDSDPSSTHVLANSIPASFEETAAEFPGGFTAMMDYFRNFTISDSSKALAGEKSICIECVISETGKPVACRLTKQIVECPECNAIGLKLIENLPNWKPENHNGMNVPTFFTKVISFN